MSVAREGSEPEVQGLLRRYARLNFVYGVIYIALLYQFFIPPAVWPLGLWDDLALAANVLLVVLFVVDGFSILYMKGSMSPTSALMSVAFNLVTIACYILRYVFEFCGGIVAGPAVYTTLIIAAIILLLKLVQTYCLVTLYRRVSAGEIGVLARQPPPNVTVVHQVPAQPTTVVIPSSGDAQIGVFGKTEYQV